MSEKIATTTTARESRRESVSRGRQTALIAGDIDDVGDGFWLTPPELMATLNTEFAFDFDACPFPRPEGFDSLREEWGRSTYVNPPIRSGKTKGTSINSFVKKALKENAKGKQVVLFLPFPRWFRGLLQANAEFRFPGPVHFLNSKGKRSKSAGGGRIPDILVILRPRRD